MNPLTRVLRAGATLAVALVFAFGVAAPPEHCPTVTTPELRGSAQVAVDWFDRNQHADGSWLYLYNADTDRAAPEYNVVRHAGALMGLYQAAAAGLPHALRSADRGTRWALDRLTARDDWSAVFLGEIPTGATALLVAGLDIRREATGDRRYDALLRRLGRFLVAQTEPSGASTRSTTRARPTGRSPASTSPSRARAGGRWPTGSAPTSRRSATTWRTTGRPLRTTGRPTGCPRPCGSPSGGGRR